jgi:hypothetical protein
MRDIVLSMYDLTGKFVQAWADAGYECYCIDIQHPAGETRRRNITFLGADMRSWRPDRAHVDRIAFVSSFSPCDDAACSGARWFKDKGLAGLASSVELFAIGRDWIKWLGVPGFCEHPRSTISTYYRAPDYKFNPCDHTAIEPGDNYTKETWIWAYNGFVMPPVRRDSALGEPDDRIHKAPPGPNRKNFRSATPMGFAREVFRVNAHSLTRKAAAERGR